MIATTAESVSTGIPTEPSGSAAVSAAPDRTALAAEAARAAGSIRAGLERNGTPIGAYDLLIGAHALQAGLILVSNNTCEFERIQGLQLENWAA